MDIFKRVITKDLKDYNAPLVMWCYFDKCHSKIINAASRDNYHFNGQIPNTFITGPPTNISYICEFGGMNGANIKIQLLSSQILSSA